MTTNCPTCGQPKRKCPICGTGVTPDPHETGPIHKRHIQKHRDGIDKDCKGRSLTYEHTVAPRGAA